MNSFFFFSCCNSSSWFVTSHNLDCFRVSSPCTTLCFDQGTMLQQSCKLLS
jgi:hypothetical protein